MRMASGFLTLGHLPSGLCPDLEKAMALFISDPPSFSRDLQNRLCSMQKWICGPE